MEIIVVDDGSTDHTKDVVEKYGDRITYITQVPGRGASAARNLGIRHASGEWIAFQDADDIGFQKSCLSSWTRCRNIQMRDWFSLIPLCFVMGWWFRNR